MIPSVPIPGSGVSVVISATAPGHSALPMTLQGVLDQTALESVEEIVIVDGYGDPDPRRFESMVAGRVRLSTLGLPCPNHARALHIGASRATGNLIWFLADDFAPTPGALAAHLDARAMRPEPHIVTVGPGRFPQALAAHPFRYWLEHEYDLTRMGFRVPADQMEGFFYAGNLVMCADFYRESGGFDPAFPYEVVFEQEFELRLSRKGMRTLQVPGALADHHHNLCLSEREQVMELAGESCARLKLMHPEHPALLPDCTADAQTHRLRADAARKRFNATRSPESRGNWWRNRLSAAFLDGYRRGWAGIEAAEAFSIAAHLRRLHVSRHRLEWKLLAGVPDADGLSNSIRPTASPAPHPKASSTTFAHATHWAPPSCTSERRRASPIRTRRSRSQYGRGTT